MNKISILFFIVVLFNSCSDKTANTTYNNIVCLIDFSTTVEKEEFDNYIDIICNQVYSNLSKDDRFVILPIDGASKELSKSIYLETSFGSNISIKNLPILYRKDSLKERINRITSENIPIISDKIKSHKQDRKYYNDATDILGALKKVEQKHLKNTIPKSNKQLDDLIGKKYEKVANNIIIVFSDMLHDEGKYKFEHEKTLKNNEKISQILNEIDDQIPNFENCTVFVTGINIKSHSKAKIIYPNLINFWNKYFEKTNSTPVCLDYDCHEEIQTYFKK